ncbi:MAG: ribosome biogenesis GTPase Der [Dictyoglomus sp.]|nr:ribosome biogenesis GTPase Der [Dictyoglomus sp.]MCX7941892.1 ribosome biogenesis GTPase Der [Dictyoglomaceae bacterium]MDW8188583.1 ribosome biogenesis GTPase Der [Dictyoglomus sp.]
MVSFRDLLYLREDIPVVSILGRPNVGKSTLFNRISGENKAITADIPGVTRDPLVHLCEYEGKFFYIIDTAGWGLSDSLSNILQERILEVINTSDLLIFVVDGREELTSLDLEFADILRKASKTVILVVNKMEGRIDREEYLAVYTSLGFENILPISALHKDNLDELISKILEYLPYSKIKEEQEKVIKFAFVGRPNSGKSSLLNALIGKYRNIVSEIPGTTRDAIDILWEYNGRKYIIVDTPGLRRPSRVEEGLEELSVRKALQTVKKVDVVLMVIDLSIGIREQEKRILHYIEEKGKSCLIIFNKTDLIPSLNARRELEKTLKIQLEPFDYFPYIFTSAIKNYNVKKIIPWVEKLYSIRNIRIPTSQLNQALREIVEKVNFSKKGKLLKFFYITQVDIAPPRFILFVNYPELVKSNVINFLENEFRDYFSFIGTPLIFEVRGRT